MNTSHNIPLSSIQERFFSKLFAAISSYSLWATYNASNQTIKIMQQAYLYSKAYFKGCDWQDQSELPSNWFDFSIDPAFIYIFLKTYEKLSFGQEK